MGLPNNWKEQISDETIFQIILPENEEYFGYMDVETLINLNYSSSIKCSHKSQFKDVLL